MGFLVIQGDARHIPLADASVHEVVSSCPYYNLRDYQTGEWVGGDPACDHKMPRQVNRVDRSVSTLHSTTDSANVATWPVCGKCGARREDRQIGLEDSPDSYIDAMRVVFRELWRVLRDDGVVFWNIGDSFANDAKGPNGTPGEALDGRGNLDMPRKAWRSAGGLKKKDMMGIPYRLAFALQADGWWWRDAIIWAKAEMVDDELEGSGMPGSQQDRCTGGYEVVLQLAKSDRYYFDIHGDKSSSGATLRNVFRINTEPNHLGHFALMPRKLAERCIRLGTSEKGCCPACLAPWRRIVERNRVATRTGQDSKVNRASSHEDSPYHGQHGMVIGNRDPFRHTTVFRTVGWEPTCRCGIDHAEPCRVLDPFGGLSTTGLAADNLGRIGITVELGREYCETARRRLEHPHAPVVKQSRKKTGTMPLLAGLED